MGENDAEVVRLPVEVRAHSRRRASESLALRFPRATAFLIRQVQRMSPRSRLRQALLRHYFRQAMQALNRGDFAAVFCIWHPDAEFIPFGGVPTALGLEGTRGREERVRFQRQWVDDWGEFRFEPEEILDFGDGRRLMWVGRTSGSGLSSGAAVGGDCAVLLEFSGGWVVREQVFFDHAQAFRAAGLSG